MEFHVGASEFLHENVNFRLQVTATSHCSTCFGLVHFGNNNS